MYDHDGDENSFIEDRAKMAKIAYQRGYYLEAGAEVTIKCPSDSKACDYTYPMSISFW